MSEYRIPFNKPSIEGNELSYVEQAIADGHISGDGGFSKKCQALLERELGAPRVLLTPSCTQALEMAALLLNIEPGDEVIVPSFTFVSTINAFVLRGARPRFADIRPDTLNIDETKLEHLFAPRTRALVVVHYAGVGCNMDGIIATARRHGVPVVEDNAQGLFGKCREKLLGTFGAMAALSFHETKNFTCGEGGALVINDPSYIERAEILREKGTDRSRFFRGQVDRYTWLDIGSSYLPSDLQAAFLFAQLEAREAILSKRRRVWSMYKDQLESWARENAVRLPNVPDYCEQMYHMFYLLLPSPAERQALMAHLKAKGILSVFHYQPLHLSRMGARYSGKRGDCPVTEDVSDRLLRLPFYTSLTEDDQREIVLAIQQFSISKGKLSRQ